MEVSEIVLIILGIQVSNFFMFLFGLLLTNTRKINLNPMEVYKENKKKKENSKDEELRALQIKETLSNLDKYDGTPNGKNKITKYL